mmetsp:Transcript_12665/g.21837  ORF Transcript_12665/g.21837 Transcript_12665/m.21837 type:complete len:82 (+) Transcript_12665:46-291(+)
MFFCEKEQMPVNAVWITISRMMYYHTRGPEALSFFWLSTVMPSVYHSMAFEGDSTKTEPRGEILLLLSDNLFSLTKMGCGA